MPLFRGVFRVDRASGASAWGGNVAVVFLLFFALVVCMYVINLDLASLSGIAG
jgi:hypothetical protein